MMNFDIGILGGGLAGTYLALKLKEKFPNASIIVLEKDKEFGGLLRSETINQFTFDIGGSHIIFSNDKEVLNEILSFLGNNLIKQKRNAKIYYKGRFIKYPFENGLGELDLEDRVYCLIEFIKALIKREKEGEKPPKNFKEWIIESFGKGIAELYMIPYNEKIWKYDLEKISAHWVYTPGRLPIPNWEDVVKSALGIETEGYKEQIYFYYPLKGGIQALYEGIKKKAEKLGVRFINSFEVKKIKKDGKRWIINDKIVVNKLYSTIPIGVLIKSLGENVPEEIYKVVERLQYNSLIVLGIALKNKVKHLYHWVYVPDNKIVFHRYIYFSNYSPHLTPPERGSLLVEITIPGNKKVNLDRVKEKAIEDLVYMEVIKEEELFFVKTWYHKFAYVVYTLDYLENMRLIRKFLDDIGIISTGRWGAFEYWNMDKVIKEIISLVNNLKL